MRFAEKEGVIVAARFNHKAPCAVKRAAFTDDILAESLIVRAIRNDSSAIR